jgi:hypothetical protein
MLAGRALLASAAVLGGGLLTAVAQADEAGKQTPVQATLAGTQRIVWKPHVGTTSGVFTARGPGCSQITASVANQYNNIDVGSEITLQAGMVEGEGFGSTYIVADPVSATTTVNEAFPIEVNLIEFIAGTAATLSGSDGSNVIMGYSIDVWDGEPNVGTSAVVFSVQSDPDPSSTGLPPDVSLQRVPNASACNEFNVLLGGAPASIARVQFSVDQTADPTDRIFVPGNATDGSGNKLNTFTIVVKITRHNVPGATMCDSVDLCNNAFLATEGSSVNGSSNGSAPTYPTRNWLYAASCGSGTAPAGFTRFSNLSSLYRPTHDVLQQVTYTPAFCAGATVGACCAASGACSSTTQQACTSTSGSSYIGDNTTCGTGTCPTGACCNTATGGCSATTAVGCTGGQAYSGDGTACNPNPCSQPTGACCTNGACTFGTAAACGSGTYQGNGTSCGSVNCPQPTGACCFGTACLTASGSDCSNAGGQYQGNSVACVSGACPTGACCIVNTGACSTATPSACAAQGGAYRGNGVACNTTSCAPPTGACCAANGFCLSNQTQSDCQNAGLAWQGGGVACSPNPCAPPAGVCCRGTVCTTGVTQANCVSPGGTVGAAFSSQASCNASGNSVSPCCYADFNKSGGLSVGDIFDYLNAWFTGSPFCKVAGDGVASPSVQDIFNFLGIWFAGGC